MSSANHIADVWAFSSSIVAASGPPKISSSFFPSTLWSPDGPSLWAASCSTGVIRPALGLPIVFANVAAQNSVAIWFFDASSESASVYRLIIATVRPRLLGDRPPFGSVWPMVPQADPVSAALSTTSMKSGSWLFT